VSKRSAISVRRFWKGIVACCVLGGVAAAHSGGQQAGAQLQGAQLQGAQPPNGGAQLTDQTILFSPVAPQSASDRVALQAVADSGLPVLFRSRTPAICTVGKSFVTLHREGVCLIQAMQPGNEVYAAAAPVTQRFTVRAAKRCCGVFDIAQSGAIIRSTGVRGTSVPPAVAEKKRAFCPMPALAADSPLTPDTWIPGSTFKIAVKGTGFTTAADATKTCPATVVTAAMNGTSITLSNLIVVNSTTITATVSVPDDLPGGLVNVYLWGPDPAKQ
jgi:hypothetical protein